MKHPQYAHFNATGFAYIQLVKSDTYGGGLELVREPIVGWRIEDQSGSANLNERPEPDAITMNGVKYLAPYEDERCFYSGILRPDGMVKTDNWGVFKSLEEWSSCMREDYAKRMAKGQL